MPVFMVARLSQLKWILTTFNQVTVLLFLHMHKYGQAKKDITIMIFCHLGMGLCYCALNQSEKIAEIGSRSRCYA
jgi:hypothetical protein